MNKCENCNQEMTHVKKIMINGRYRITGQCSGCGWYDSLNYKYSLFENYLKIPDFDFKAWERYKENRNAITKIKRNIAIKEREQIWEERKEKYERYINSTEWREKRKIAFKKWGTRCFICNIENANEVHHVSYKNLYNETDKDMVILCHHCHINVVHNEDYPQFLIEFEDEIFEEQYVNKMLQELDIYNTLAIYNHLDHNFNLSCRVDGFLISIHVDELFPKENKITASKYKRTI